MRIPPRALVLFASALLVASCSAQAGSAHPAAETLRAGGPKLVPVPSSVRTVPGESFRIGKHARIVVPRGAPRAAEVGRYLAGVLRPATGFRLPVVAGGKGALKLELTGSGDMGREGYRLETGRAGIRLRAKTAEGLFRGVQTLRQLLPAKVESRRVRRGPWNVPGVRIADRPRFAWRGVQLDVARHFFTVGEVKRFLDLAALYKINTLHLHLTDDQGWRIAIAKWPRLASVGGSVEVGGGKGGYFTRGDYTEIIRYAAKRFITVVPEIDGPAHVGAALTSYAELNCDGKARPPQTGQFGSASLCLDKEISYTFMRDVITEVAALTPGPYFNVGADEPRRITDAVYATYVGRVQQMVKEQGKTLMGWHEAAKTPIPKGSVIQYWGTPGWVNPAFKEAQAAVQRGARLVMSPANRAFLDMKYRLTTPYGHFTSWAGLIDVRKSYEWDPAKQVAGVGERNIFGVEAAVWTGGIDGNAQLDYMAFPRLPGIAEVGWSPQGARSWVDYRQRLAAQGPRWQARSVNFYRSTEVAWP